MSLHSFVRNTAFRAVFGSGFTRAYILVVEMALVILSASLLSPHDRGIYVAGIGLIKTMAVFTTLSLGQIAIHGISSSGAGRSDELGKQAGNLLMGGAVLSLLAIAGFHLAGDLSPSFQKTYVEPFQWLVIIGLPIYLYELYLYTLLTAANQLSTANLAIIIGKTATWGPVMVSAYFNEAISMMALVFWVVLGQFLIVAGYGWILQRMRAAQTIVIRFDPSSLYASVKSAIRLYPTIISSIVFSGFDLLLIFNYRGAAETSTYQIALQGIAALSVLPFAVAQYGYSTISKHGTTDGWKRYRKVLYAGLGLHVVIAAVSLVAVGFAEPLLVEHGYPGLRPVYLLLAIGSPGVYLSLTMAPMWIGFGFFLRSSAISIATAALIVPLATVLVKQHGALGAAYAFLLAQGLSILTNGLLIYYSEKNGNK